MSSTSHDQYRLGRRCRVLLLSLGLLSFCTVVIGAQSVERPLVRVGVWEASVGTLGSRMFQVPGNYTAALSVGHRWQNVWKRVDLRVNALYRPVYGASEGIGLWSSGLWRFTDVPLGSLALEPYVMGGVGSYTLRARGSGVHWGAGMLAGRGRASVALEWTQHPELRMSLLMLSIGLRPR